MRTYAAQPETTSEVLGVIVIVETSEVDKYIQEVTDKLAREGHVPVAPVLYHRVGFNPLFGHTGEDADVRTRAMGSLKIYPGADHGFMAMSARVLG
jgi:dienelactone hydrolase